MNPFDVYMNNQFKKYCPDSAKFLESLNPIARKHAEEDRFFFTVGMLIRNNFSDDEIIGWDVAVSETLCPKCRLYDKEDSCEIDPKDCDIFALLEDEYLKSINNGDVRNE